MTQEHPLQQFVNMHIGDDEDTGVGALLKMERELANARVVSELHIMLDQHHKGLITTHDLLDKVAYIGVTTPRLRPGDQDLIQQVTIEADDGESFLRKLEASFSGKIEKKLEASFSSTHPQNTLVITLVPGASYSCLDGRDRRAQQVEPDNDEMFRLQLSSDAPAHLGTLVDKHGYLIRTRAPGDFGPERICPAMGSFVTGLRSFER